MQISKTFLIVCAAVGCAGSICFGAPDSPSQAQAREALRQKIAELNAQESAVETPAPKAPKKKKTTAAPTPQPVVQPPPVTVTPPPAVAPAGVAPVVSKPAGKPAEVIEAEKAAAAAEEKRLADEAKARRAAAAEASARAKAEKQAAAEAKKAKSDKPKPEATTVTSPVTLAPVEPPPSAVSASKEAKLAELLRKYKSDSITPDEYHKERARILAEP